MIHVVAKDQAEYQDWCSSPRPGSYTYVHSAKQIDELEDIRGLFIGTCFDRPDIIQILASINEIREFNSKKKIPLNDISHLTRYKTTDHSFLTTSWSQNNIPVANGGIGTSYATMSGTSYNTMIADEYTIVPPSSYKVPISPASTGSESMFRLQAAKLYSSYITNGIDSKTDKIEYYFTDRNHAQDFAAKYNSTAYEYI